MYHPLQDPALHLALLDAPPTNVSLNSIDSEYPFCLYFLTYTSKQASEYFWQNFHLLPSQLG